MHSQSFFTRVPPIPRTQLSSASRIARCVARGCWVNPRATWQQSPKQSVLAKFSRVVLTMAIISLTARFASVALFMILRNYDQPNFELWEAMLEVSSYLWVIPANQLHHQEVRVTVTGGSCLRAATQQEGSRRPARRKQSLTVTGCGSHAAYKARGLQQLVKISLAQAVILEKRTESICCRAVTWITPISRFP